MSEFPDSVEEDKEDVASVRERKLAELSAKREAKEISPFDMDLNFLWQCNEYGAPLTRSDLRHATGEQAVVLTKEDFETLGFIRFINPIGDEMNIDSDQLSAGDVFVLYPHELGDLPKKEEE